MKTIIFDLDGTLLDVREGAYWQFQRLTAEFDGQPVANDKIRAAMSGTVDEIIRSVVKNTFVPFDQIRHRHEELRAEANARHLKLYPGTEQLLRALRGSGYKIAALTSGNHQTLACLGEFNIAQYFQEVVSAKDIINHKPHPEGIELLLQRLGSERQDAVMVGDTTADVLAGKNGGVGKTIGVTHGFDSEAALREAGADHIVHDLPSILEVLERHELEGKDLAAVHAIA